MSGGGSPDIEYGDRPATPFLAELVAYWEGKRDARMAPRRADIDPTEIPRHLPHVFLIDVVDEAADFRFRLIGTEVARGAGRDSTGKLLSVLYRNQPQALATMTEGIRLMLARKRPLFARGRIYWLPERNYRRFATVLMPLSNDGATINLVLGEMILLT